MYALLHFMSVVKKWRASELKLKGFIMTKRHQRILTYQDVTPELVADIVRKFGSHISELQISSSDTLSPMIKVRMLCSEWSSSDDGVLTEEEVTKWLDEINTGHKDKDIVIIAALKEDDKEYRSPLLCYVAKNIDIKENKDGN